MKHFITLCCVVLTSLAFAFPVAAAPDKIDTITLLRQETDISQLPYLRDWQTHLQSSYDRSGGNWDAGNYLSVKNGTATLADMDGPGAVVRIWSANPTGEIKIYIDNNPVPVVDMPFAQMFDGSTPPFLAPLAQPSSGGFYSYIPIAYAKHCRVTVDKPGSLYYHVAYVTYPPNTSVQSFGLPFTDAENSAVAAACQMWQSPESQIDRLDCDTTTYGATVNAFGAATIADFEGGQTIEQLRLKVDATDANLRKLVLRAYFDNHRNPDIEVPVADFFGCAFGRKPFSSLLLSQGYDGTMVSNFPMPFAHSAWFTLENGTGVTVHATLVALMRDQGISTKTEGYFHAQWNQEITRYGVPHIWVRLKDKRGHFVGVVQTMASRGYLTFLEGDDQFRVDRQTWLPCKVTSTTIGPWNGTGTEDCFNSGWYFRYGPVSLPVNGALVKDTPTGAVDAYRWFLNDAPVFQQSVDGQIEHGGVNDSPGVYYSSVAYWYGTGESEPIAKMPSADRIGPPHAPPDPNVPGAIEGESLIGTSTVTGGDVSIQNMDVFGPNWSGGAQLWWHPAKVGDTLTLTLPARAGEREVVAYFTMAVDYGKFGFTLNGQPLGGPRDFFNPCGVANTGPVSLGKAALPNGPSRLVVTVLGKSQYSKGLLFGLDAIVLK